MVGLRGSIKSRGKNPFSHLKGAMDRVKKRLVKVGYFDGKPYPNKESYTYASMMNMHELGLGGQVSRPVFLIASNDIKAGLKNFPRVKDIFKDVKTMDDIGEYMKGKVGDVFGSNKLAENSPSTNSPATPMIDTGQLLNGLESRVE